MRTRSIRLLMWSLAASLALPVTVVHAGGTIEGTVTFEGRPRRNPLIQMGADPNCLTINAGKKVVQELVSLNRDKTVSNVFVHIVEDVPDAAAAPAEPVLVVQEGCIYHPRISGAVTGQTLRIRNSDATLHNIHTQSEEGNGFNVGQPKAGMEHDHTLRGQEVMLRLKCDVHPWMIGFVGVKSHPYFAVSGDDGAFRIEGVPAGTYTLQAWQEKLGSVDQTIEVVDGETVTVALGYGAPTSAALAPPLPVRELRLPEPGAVVEARDAPR